ncbi:MAG: HAMP domain-containing sensor histidine kinase [Arcobacter sp.]|jgi:two-component system chemotaxis sensor kinase CheA|uniref:sensor histidine kinase n=1 Tax=Arcobacter sp. TaxID=1872629 RepID=UPI002A74D428|nr:HAMP domain-containing sensor histidine kinase [Arcobacter sp.]MDY3203921.1 HAMP domain-containing sensor histidine kinase [Arcobacter sp.]
MVLFFLIEDFLIIKGENMFMEHLALTYKCHSSIGNSLDLNSMIKEIITTFVEETNAINGFFYLIDENNDIYKYISYNNSLEFDKELLKEYIQDLKYVKIFDFEQNKLLVLPLDKGIFYIIYENSDINFEYITSMFQDLIVKLNISIDACLNVQRMKNKNKILKHLTNELKEQQKKLIESDKYKNDFLANMSHELKTPLNSIIVISSIMAKNKNKKLDDEQVKNMKIINNCGNDLLLLINDILDISKIEAGEIAINLTKTNINQLIDDLITQMQPLAIEKNILLISNGLLNEIYLLTDSNRIKQILKNLISNAIKFTQEGKIEVLLEENANDLTIKVIDEGIGIPKEKLNHIFERFKQADGSTTRKYGGTGLGLAISKELALLLGADIKAFSEVEKGSTFELILPKKTNIKNISDDKVTIFSKNENEVIDDIVFFDMDENVLEETKLKQEEKILIINSDYSSFFPIAVSLKKQGVIIDYFNSFEESLSFLEKGYKLVLIYEKNLSSNLDEILEYLTDKNLNYLVITTKENDNKNFLKKEFVKIELLNKILTYLGK